MLGTSCESGFCFRWHSRDQLIEYQSLPSVDTILFIDPDNERVPIVSRAGAECWADNWMQPGEEVALPRFR